MRCTGVDLSRWVARGRRSAGAGGRDSHRPRLSRWYWAATRGSPRPARSRISTAGLVAVDVFGLGASWGPTSMVAAVGVLAGGLGNFAGSGAELVERFVDMRWLPLYRRRRSAGRRRHRIEVVVLVIIGVEVKGAGPFRSGYSPGGSRRSGPAGRGSKYRGSLDFSAGSGSTGPSTAEDRRKGLGVSKPRRRSSLAAQAVVGLEVGHGCPHDVYHESD